MRGKKVYEKSPVYTSDRFLLRPVELSNAQDLLQCYSDASAVQRMNADNCTNDFNYKTLDEMRECIQGWLVGHERNDLLRFSIVDKRVGKAVGTIEIYDKTETLGVLRLDLRSAYETRDHILELLRLSLEHFYGAFEVRHLLTKAIPSATDRISALRACGFAPAADNPTTPRGDYSVHWIWASGKKERVRGKAMTAFTDYYIR
jgi:[ribosomal protein S5]-alanine N-acetyltransferase